MARVDLIPIDVHTPMWLGSRGKFTIAIQWRIRYEEKGCNIK